MVPADRHRNRFKKVNIMPVSLDRSGENKKLQDIIIKVKQQYRTKSAEKAIQRALAFLIEVYPQEKEELLNEIRTLRAEKKKYDKLIDSLNFIKSQL